LTFSTLSPEEQDCIQSSVLRRGYGIKGPADKELNYLDNIHAEPTQEMPDGIPSNSRMTMKEEVIEQFFTNTSTTLTNASSDMRGQPMDMNWLAVQPAMSQRPDLFPLGT